MHQFSVPYSPYNREHFKPNKKIGKKSCFNQKSHISGFIVCLKLQRYSNLLMSKSLQCDATVRGGK